MRYRFFAGLLGLAALILASCTPGAVLTTGSTAPVFELFDVNGKTVSLSDYTGRPVMLNFWGTD